MARKHRFKIDKLIRDKLPQIMRSNGIEVFERVMEEEEYTKRLKDKLLEEVQEVLEAKNQADIKEELADVLEVIITLSKVHGLSFEDIEAARAKKKIDKGGFEGRVYNALVEIDSTNEDIGYYLARPDQYPEIN